MWVKIRFGPVRSRDFLGPRHHYNFAVSILLEKKIAVDRTGPSLASDRHHKYAKIEQSRLELDPQTLHTFSEHIKLE